MAGGGRGKVPAVDAWVQAAHPWPLAIVVSLTLLSGVAAAGASVSWSRLLLLAVAILGNQLATGWSNDYLDRERDLRFRREKPLVRGDLDASALSVGAVLAALTSVLAAALLGMVALLWLLLGSAAGLAYNLGVKDTPLSWLPYVVAFVALPFFTLEALDAYRSQLLWLFPIALSLAPAAHLANALPDIATDVAAGSRGLAARLGRGGALWLVGAGLLLPVVLLLVSALFLPFDAATLTATLTAYGVLVVAAGSCYAKRRDRAGFRFVTVACLALLVGSIGAL
jgi:4-hydroxybenzoate polyprenyltransferase